MRIDSAAHHERTVSPHFTKELASARNRAVSPQKSENKLVRLGCETAFVSASQHNSCREIDCDVAEANFAHRLRRRLGCTSQESRNSLEELDNAERFRDVLIRVE